MKTRTLIEALQKADPSGEEQVVLPGNEAIHFVEKLPAYYDGACEEVEYDVDGNAVRGRLRRTGNKVKIHSASLSWILMDNPELPVDLPTKEEDLSEGCKQDVEKWREEARDFKTKHKELFPSEPVVVQKSAADLSVGLTGPTGIAGNKYCTRCKLGKHYQPVPDSTPFGSGWVTCPYRKGDMNRESGAPTPDAFSEFYVACDKFIDLDKDL
jgi:hypothetical protein